MSTTSELDSSRAPTLGSLTDNEQHEALVRSLLDFVPEGITVAFGPDAVIYTVSRHGLDLIQRSDAEVTKIGAQKHPEAWQVYELDGKTIVPGDRLPLTRACRGEEVRGVQLLIRRSDGNLFPILCNAGPIRSKDGEVIGGVIAWRDISDMQKLLHDAQVARAEAEAATRSRDMFMAKLSHDLRTPLQSVLGWLKIAKSRMDDPAQLKRAFEVIERNTRTQARLIDDLLDQNRIASGNLQLSLERTSVAEVVTAGVESLQPLASERGVAVIADFGSAVDVHVNADATRLHQVMCNLISNAIKFSPRDSEVRVLLRRQVESVVIEVQDEGIGIAADHLGNIFEPFWQAPGGQDRGGLGLGLSIVRHLVQAHAGEISVASGGIGLGSTFRVTLPLFEDLVA